MFQHLFGIHEKALLLYGERMGVLAANLANADTPGYKARDIDFRQILAQSAGDDASGRSLAIAGPRPVVLASPDPGQISPSAGGSSPVALKYRIPYQASLDGNTVEMPVEQAAFAENNVRYQASLGFINDEISDLRLAITGQ
ncbi:MAG: flagellar basal body rod protein FlgB [Gammaproteobacteria bacterium]|nr:flagellar basal body rod protein FlgB [Gammaproteobacteria bacterium]